MALSATKKYNIRDFAYIVSELIKGGGGGGTVDDELSLVSENPVQNKVVTGALNGKQATLTAGDNIEIDEANVINATVPDEFIESVDSTITVTDGQASVTNPLPIGTSLGQLLGYSEALSKFNPLSGRMTFDGSGVYFNRLDTTALTHNAPTTATATGENASYPIANVFDDSFSTYFRTETDVVSSTINLTFSTAKTLTALAFNFSISGQKPLLVIIEAKVGEEYIEISRYRDFDKENTPRNELKYYVIESPVESDDYNIKVSDVSSTYIRINEIKLLTGTISWLPEAMFNNEGKFWQIPENTANYLVEDFRKPSNAGFSQYSPPSYGQYNNV
jgi:hypothetical protein